MRLNQFPDRELFRQMAQDHNVIPVCTEILADTLTPVSILKQFYRTAPVFLLESMEGGERWGRYSFLGTSAHAHIRVFRKTVEIRKRDGHIHHIAHHGDPLRVLKDMMERYRPANLQGLPRFWGGMVGYLTYEMVSFFEPISHNRPDDKPLAHFVIPDELVIFDNIRHTLMCIATGFPVHASDADRVYDEAAERIESMLKVLANTPTAPPRLQRRSPLQADTGDSSG